MPQYPIAGDATGRFVSQISSRQCYVCCSAQGESQLDRQQAGWRTRNKVNNHQVDSSSKWWLWTSLQVLHTAELSHRTCESGALTSVDASKTAAAVSYFSLGRPTYVEGFLFRRWTFWTPDSNLPERWAAPGQQYVRDWILCQEAQLSQRDRATAAWVSFGQNTLV